ncbi:hypothetical protein FRC03_012772 [Tulasnella sp. 419]|nr:hypothetical protein FRC03_012772 [Tulasnella sp. 419]
MALSVQRVVFLSLLLDLFAFTIPLPLFPRLVEWYVQREEQSRGLLYHTLQSIRYLRSRFLHGPAANEKKSWDVVLLGGLLGSFFSMLQFIISPHIGSLSDRFGRKKVLLATMVGNVLSGLVWLKSTSFSSYLISRAIGGISEGNVQLSIAIISDVTTPETRSRDLSLVGIAFAICFCIGPPIGAWFSTHPLSPSLDATKGVELNIYATPALLTLVLLGLEIILLVVALPETRDRKVSDKKEVSGQTSKIPVSPEKRLANLKALGRIHFFFLALFSGVEFTLTFLSFDLFDWNNAQNGRLLMTIGIISTILQGGYVRRVKVRESVLARRGVMSCALATIILSTLPSISQSDQKPRAVLLLYVAASLLAYTSATVVNSLNALASLQCDESVGGNTTSPDLSKGRALGRFRSTGQLGRAIGPILACAAYWGIGPQKTYSLSAIAMTSLVLSTESLLKM